MISKVNSKLKEEIVTIVHQQGTGTLGSYYNEI